MKRSNTILTALCAIIISLLLVNDSWGIDNQDIWEGINRVTHEYAVQDEDNFEGNIQFPPNPEVGWVGDDLEEDEVYTLVFPAGIDVTLDGSLTIAVNDESAIGRIQVNGTAEAGGMVTMDEADNGWGGILVQTDPEGGNLIKFCEVVNVTGTGISAIAGEFNTVQAEIASCDVHECTNNGILVQGWDENINYSVRDNHVHNNGVYGIQAISSMMDAEYRPIAVVRNTVHDNGDAGIFLELAFNGYCANNLVYDNEEEEITTAVFLLPLGSPVPSIINNTIDGNDDGVGINCFQQGNGNPWPVLANNIVVSCPIAGIQGPGGQNPPEVDFCLVFDCGNNAYVGCVEGEGGLDDDPGFIGAADYHLGAASPAIDEGDDNYGIDLNFTHNDTPAFGRPALPIRLMVGLTYLSRVYDLSNEARKQGVHLRQSYVRVSQKILLRCSNYGRARQFKRITIWDETT